MIIGEFIERYSNRYQILQSIKTQGKQVIGWVCTYVPEEIIHAAGMHPFRIVGQESDTPLANAYLYSNNCSFARSCLEEGLKGNLAFMDGFVTTNSCDHIRRLYDVWSTYINTSYKKILSQPCVTSPTCLNYFKQELKRFKEELETHFQVEISETHLKDSIGLFNHMRSLLKRIYNLRKLNPPPLSGEEICQVVMAGMILPKEEYIPLLESLLKEIESRQYPVPDNSRPRLMVVGSELDNPLYLKLIEDSGGLVVADDLCCGSRYFWDLVAENKDPLEALATRYLTKLPCARMHPASARVQQLKELAQEFQVEGIIYQSIKFCDLHAGIFPVIKSGFDELNIPVLKLEREYLLAGTGQTKTRIQAFIEVLKEN
jgi:bzd-type benzoyl-CoA reductase N subunit